MSSWTERLAPRPEHDETYHEIYETFMQRSWIESIGLDLEDFPAPLRIVIMQCFSSPYPSLILWGSDHVQIYNAAYLEYIARPLHPEMMGEKWIETWSPILPDAEYIAAQYTGVLKEGQTIAGTDICHFLPEGRVKDEEVYSNYNLGPCFSADGDVLGIVLMLVETTKTVVSRRRDNFLLMMHAAREAVISDEETFKAITEAVQAQPLDIPCMALYWRDPDDFRGTESANANAYKAVVTVGLESACIPSSIESSEIASYLPIPKEERRLRDHISEAMSTGCPVRIDDEFIISMFCQRRAFSDVTKTVWLTPIFLFGLKEPVGLALQGINPRRDQEENELVGRLKLEVKDILESIVRRRQEAQTLQDRTAELAASKLTFEVMAQACPVGIFIIDPETMKFDYVNDAFWDIAGIPRECEPDQWMEHCHPDSMENVERAWRSMSEGQAMQSAEIRWARPWRGSFERWSSWTSVQHEDSSGKKRIFGAFQDASPLYYALKIEKERGDVAIQTKKQQLEFLDMIAHELRNPLGAIMQSSDFLIGKLCGQESDVPDKLLPQKAVTDADIEDLRTIVLCAKHMSRIINDTLNLSKLEGGMLIATHVPVRPVDVAQSVLSMLTAEAKSNDTMLNLVVESSFSRLGLDWVETDPSRLAQILINLIANALKFVSKMQTKNVTVSIGASKRPQDIRVEVNRRPSNIQQASPATTYELKSPRLDSEDAFYLIFKVTDTGPGISEEQIQSLFQRYFQVSPKTHVEYGGSGLGLFISRQLVNLLGGTMGVESTVGQGTTFTFCIKTFACESPTKDSASNLKVSSVCRSQAPCDVVKTILIAEDNLINQKILVKQLHSIGCETIVANNGREVIDALLADRARDNRIALCLCDVEMPLLDGIEAIREVRRLEQTGILRGRCPFIAVTANAREVQLREMLAAGMDDTVPKPFRLPTLLNKITELTERLGLPSLVPRISKRRRSLEYSSSRPVMTMPTAERQPLATPPIKHRPLLDLLTNSTDQFSSPCSIILLNTSPTQPAARRLWQKGGKTPNCTRICTDGATDRLHAEVFNCSLESMSSTEYPDVVIGDLDSIQEPTRAFYENCPAVQVIEEHDQNSTDFTKAIRHLSADPHSSIQDIIVLGGIDGRLDQTFSTIHSLFMRPRIYILDKSNIVMLLEPGSHEIDCTGVGPHCGLVPVKGPVRCWTTGFQWCLDGETMAFDGLISTNNRVVSEDSKLFVKCDQYVLFSVEVQGFEETARK